MKILRFGKFPTIEVTCPKCESLLEINKLDAKLGGGNIFYVVCPCCDEIVKLSEEQKQELNINLI